MSEHGCHIKPEPIEAGMPRRRASDVEDMKARQMAWDVYRLVKESGTVYEGVMAALSSYKESLCIMAVKSYGGRVR